MVFCQHVYLCTICVPGVKGGWKKALSPLEWSYRCLWATMWMLGMELRSARRVASALQLNHLSPL